MNETGMRKLSLDEIKKHELDLLLAFNELAKEHGIQYTLAGGTLLGAVRHKGFIPWDDDIDVLVPRPDYERLLDLVRSGTFDGERFSFRAYALGNYPVPFTKMVDPSIRVHDSATKKSIPSNLWIDLFPLDGVPSDDGRWNALCKRAVLCKNIIKIGNYRFLGAGKGLGNRLAKMVAMPFVVLFRLNDRAERTIQGLWRSGIRFDSADCYASMAWCTYGVRERFPRTLLDETVEVEFEGHRFPAMGGWKAYLTNLYGDFMQLPPLEERVAHGVEAWVSDAQLKQGGGR